MVRGKLPTGVRFNLVLNSRVIADAVLESGHTATAVSIADSLEQNYDCRRYSRGELLDRLGMLIYWRRAYIRSPSSMRGRVGAGSLPGKALPVRVLCFQHVIDSSSITVFKYGLNTMRRDSMGFFID